MAPETAISGAYTGKRIRKILCSDVNKYSPFDPSDGELEWPQMLNFQPRLK